MDGDAAYDSIRPGVVVCLLSSALDVFIATSCICHDRRPNLKMLNGVDRSRTGTARTMDKPIGRKTN